MAAKRLVRYAVAVEEFKIWTDDQAVALGTSYLRG